MLFKYMFWRQSCLFAKIVMLAFCMSSGAINAQVISTPNTLYRIAGGATYGPNDGVGPNAQFGGIYGITKNIDGNLYVADYSNHAIRKITPSGVVTTFAGIAGSSGSADGIGSAARFYQPVGITSDAAGNLYVSDTYNNTIRKITPTGLVSTLAGTPGVVGSADGIGSAAQFNTPHSITLANDGNLYVADFWNHTIRKITLEGVVTTLAGTAGSVGSADGTGAAAQFSRPTGITTDSSTGNLYVVDRHNHTVRKVTLAGVVTTLAGTPGISGNADGVGTNAQFYFPFSIASDTSGNLYVTDTLNYTVRKVTASGVVTTVVGTAGINSSGSYPASLPGTINLPEGIGMLNNGQIAFSNSGTELLGANFLYNFDGFKEPVNNPPVLNVLKAGSAVPVKFGLGGNQGLNIFAQGYPASQQVTCNLSSPTDAIEETVTAGASSLTYDGNLDQYIYVWKTDKAWLNTCRQLIIRLLDGSDHKALFNFTK